VLDSTAPQPSQEMAWLLGSYARSYSINSLRPPCGQGLAGSSSGLISSRMDGCLSADFRMDENDRQNSRWLSRTTQRPRRRAAGHGVGRLPHAFDQASHFLLPAPGAMLSGPTVGIVILIKLPRKHVDLASDAWSPHCGVRTLLVGHLSSLDRCRRTDWQSVPRVANHVTRQMKVDDPLVTVATAAAGEGRAMATASNLNSWLTCLSLFAA
jgi:hypothetical protein